MSRIQSVPMFNPDGCHAAGTQERAHLFLGVRIKGSFPEMFELKNE